MKENHIELVRNIAMEKGHSMKDVIVEQREKIENEKVQYEKRNYIITGYLFI
ncbi:MAG: hypothetical protein ABUK01_18645 [Leptospirales bacterium]